MGTQSRLPMIRLTELHTNLETEGIIEDNDFPSQNLGSKLRLSGFTGELNMVKAGDIGRSLRGLLYKARSPEEMKLSYGRLANGFGATVNLLIM